MCDLVSEAFQFCENGTATELVTYLPETTSSIFFLLKNVFSMCICVHLCTLVEDNLEDLEIKFRLSGSEILTPWAISPALALLLERMPASSSLAYGERSPVYLGIVGRVIDLDILWWGRGLDLAPFMKDREHKTGCVFKQHNMGTRAKRNTQKIGGSYVSFS